MREDLEKFVEKYPTYIEALEQLGELKQRIAKLEEELKQWKDGTIILKWSKAENRIKELEKQAEIQKEIILKFQQENAKLTEQLKTAVMPKYKVGQNVWFVDEDDGEIREARVLSIELEDRIILYTILWGDFCELYRQEEFLFETEEEAQNYVKEVGE